MCIRDSYLREQAGTDLDTDLNIPGGAVVVDPNTGYQDVDPVQRAIGNPNPDFIIGWNNVFTYKRLTANFLLDWREGGDLWNGTAWALSFFGTSQLTADTREETPFAIDGVKPVFDAEGNQVGFEQNDIEIVSCLLYTSPSPRDATLSRMPSSA